MSTALGSLARGFWSPRLRFFPARILAAACAGTLLLGVGVALGQGPQPAAPGATPPPQARELLIPRSGPIRAGQGRRVEHRDPQGREVVSLLHAEVGNRRLVIRPDGQLESLLTTDARLTEKPFKADSKESIAAGLKQSGFGKFKTRETARYLYLYNTSEEFQKGTSRILETMYPAILAYFKRLKLPVQDPEVPLVAIMFRTEAEFQKFQQMPDSVVAYYNGITNQIVMFEQSKLVELAPELAVKQSIGTIAHEGVHQILHNIGVQQRLSRWPMWISEGLAEYFAPTSVDKRMRWKGVGMPHDLRMHELDGVMRRVAGADDAGEMVRAVSQAKQLTSSGYAAAWALTHYLASRQKEKFQGYLREVAQFGPLEPREGVSSAARDPQALFVKYFGADYDKLGEALVKHLRSLPYVDPIANQTHYVMLLDTSRTRSASVTYSPAHVKKWQDEALLKVPPELRAAVRFEVLPFENKQLADEYARKFLGRP